MKTKLEATRRVTIAMALFAIITLALIGCDGDDKPTDNPPVPYGTLPNGVGIYKGDAGVTDAQMTTVITKITSAYGTLTQTEKTAVNNTLTQIRIISNKDYTWDGHILGVGFDQSEDVILGGLQAIAVGGLPLAY